MTTAKNEVFGALYHKCWAGLSRIPPVGKTLPI